MLSFTPVILTGTSYILLHEVPSLSGFAGICIIVSGSYVLNISAEDEHFLDPVKSMLRNQGSWYMLIVALLFAVSINFDKIAMLNSDPFFGMALTVIAIGVAFVIMSAYSLISGRNMYLQKLAGNAYPAPHQGPLHSRRESIPVLLFLLAHSLPSRLRPLSLHIHCRSYPMSLQ